MNWLSTGVNGLQEWQQRLDHAMCATAQERRHRKQLGTSLATHLAKYQQLKKAAFSRGPLRRSVLIANFLEGDNMDFGLSQTALTLGLDPLQVQPTFQSAVGACLVSEVGLHQCCSMLACINTGLHQYWLASVLACINADTRTIVVCASVSRTTHAPIEHATGWLAASYTHRPCVTVDSTV